MSEEEKEAIEKLRNTAKQCHQSECWDIESCSDCYVEVEDIKAIDIVLNLVERLQVELEQEKEKNEELEIELSIRDNISVDKLVEKYRYYRRLADSYQANCISKDKLKEKIEENIKEADDVLVNHNYLGNFNGNNKEQEHYYNGFKDASLFIGDLL